MDEGDEDEDDQGIVIKVNDDLNLQPIVEH